MKKTILLFILFINVNLVYSQIDYPFKSFSHFLTVLDSITNIQNETDRNNWINALLDTLRANNQIPFAFGDSVAFLYLSSSNSVYWAGDFNGWNPNTPGYKGTKSGLSNINFIIKSFPSNARLDYKIVVNNNWIMDPENPYVQYGGYGPNSELRMPDYIYPEETIRKPDYPRGSLSGNLSIFSSNLGYLVFFKVYIPYNYDSKDNLPVIYVTDGHEYSDDRLGSMIIVLDNLIYEELIQPVITVFIDPRSTPNSSGTNRRAEQYTMNPNFANFAADELIPYIDSNYKTNASSAARAILGTSLGGINSAYFGVLRPDKFRLIIIHSPAFWYTPEIYSEYENAGLLPLKIFMSTGTISDTQDGALNMKSILDNKGYPLNYIEVPEGHSWGNWRALLDDPLIYFFESEIPVNVNEESDLLPSEFELYQNYPNPFNPTTTIEYSIPSVETIYRTSLLQTTLIVYDILGKEIATLVNEKQPPGKHKVIFDARDLPSGIYFYKFSMGNFSDVKKLVFLK